MVDREEDQQQQQQQQEDRLLPIANVGRIMKQVLPQRAKVSKEGKQRMQECATEFLSFVTAEASDKCRKENRKTVNGDDICWALTSLGFDNYAEATTRYLNKYREAERIRLAANNSQIGNVNINTTYTSLTSQLGNHHHQSLDLEFRIFEKGDNSKPS